jgi:hypothetical protein
MDDGSQRPLRVGVVGPCTAGKSTLIHVLREAGYEARHIAQEHSYVKDMWRRLTNPDVLIYLDVKFESAKNRRSIWWGPERLDDQAERLSHARAHCDLYILTDLFTPEEVAEKVLTFLMHRPGK